MNLILTANMLFLRSASHIEAGFGVAALHIREKYDDSELKKKGV